MATTDLSTPRGAFRGAVSIGLLAFVAMLLASPPAAANSTQVLISHGLISQDVGDGGDLFFRETFDGNGRTCGSCHPVDNNQTIDPEFIATLPANDPLFVAENDPLLAELEQPVLMRQFGLILENVDGFQNPTEKFVMRGVPHSLSMVTSIEHPDGTDLPPDPTGWSGDGSPDGTLLGFSAGAVNQHFPKTLQRVPGVDFREPTETELQQMRAFMVSVGRLDDIDLQTVSVTDSEAATGLAIFLNADPSRPIAAGKCNLCHLNAGANSGIGGNRNFDTGVEEVPHDGRKLAEVKFPFDGGFGTKLNEEGTFGDGEFNTTPLVEAADTGPFFHNDVIATLEEAVAFYGSGFFNNSPAAQLVGPISLSQTDADAVSAFLRVLNAAFNLAISDQRNGAAIVLENSGGGCGGSTQELSEKCFSFEVPGKRATVDMLLSLANAEAADAVEVLEARGLHGTSVQKILLGIDLNEQAIAENSSSRRKQLMQDAQAQFQSAKADFGTGFDFVLGEGNLMF